MISVVIPLYNKAHTIVNTLTTVMKQTYKEFEVIIVNDGSTDNGVEVIKSNFNDPKIRIINQENAGVSAARNKGVQEAQGNWIAFLDADDEWLPQYLETLINVLKEHPQADLIGCASYYKDFKTKKISANALIDKYFNKSVKINYFINPDKMTHIGATLISKKTFLAFGGFDTSLINNEDLLLLGSIAMYGYFVYIGKCLHVYVGNVMGQATSNISQQETRIKNNIEVQNRFYILYKKGNKKNNLVPISIKYRSRHLFLQLLKKKNYHTLQTAISQLSPDLRKILGFTNLMLKPSLNKPFILYLYITKLIWKMHGFPKVGTPSKYNSTLTKEYHLIYG